MILTLSLLVPGNFYQSSQSPRRPSPDGFTYSLPSPNSQCPASTRPHLRPHSRRPTPSAVHRRPPSTVQHQPGSHSNGLIILDNPFGLATLPETPPPTVQARYSSRFYRDTPISRPT
ncbi:hypothetical protein BKA56DRAFT_252525 [Ilyonectria sp. MPI-CAGE-AT-0026]|nr:hypothetical protein BKA56DRAFT_252525 [Ilyonectria sp. MPI-CAGE-AT-0026]